MRNLPPFSDPKSVCACGHTGDGANSQHALHFQEGHGPCTVPGCNCSQFQWSRWTPANDEILANFNKGA